MFSRGGSGDERDFRLGTMLAAFARRHIALDYRRVIDENGNKASSLDSRDRA